MTDEHRKAIDSLAEALSEKGYERPEARITITSGKPKFYLVLAYRASGKIENKYFWSHLDDPLGDAFRFVNDLPTAESVAQKIAFEQLSESIAAARAAGLDFLFEMKTENLITAS